MAENLDFLRAAVASSAHGKKMAAMKLDSVDTGTANLDSVGNAAANNYAERDCRLRAAAVLQQSAQLSASLSISPSTSPIIVQLAIVPE